MLRPCHNVAGRCVAFLQQEGNENMLSFFALLAACYAAAAFDLMLFCYVVDRAGHDHHEEDHLFNLDGSEVDRD